MTVSTSSRNHPGEMQRYYFTYEQQNTFQDEFNNIIIQQDNDLWVNNYLIRDKI